MLDRIFSHAKRVSYHLGRRVSIGDSTYEARGYFAGRLDYSDRHEPFLGAVLQRQLRAKPGALIDVGVNVGQTLMKMLGIDRNREYVGFEPQIACCFFVDQFLRLNSLKNAVVLPMGLSDSNSIATLFSRGQYDEMASLTGPDDVTGTRRPDATHIQTRVGDDVLKELNVGAISMIKIDVEGAEMKVLSGLVGTLERMRPAVVFEVLPSYFGVNRMMQPPDVCKKNQAAADAIFSLLTGVGYSIYQLDDSGAEKQIQRFVLDDPRAFVSSNYIARSS